MRNARQRMVSEHKLYLNVCVYGNRATKMRATDTAGKSKVWLLDGESRLQRGRTFVPCCQVFVRMCCAHPLSFEPLAYADFYLFFFSCVMLLENTMRNLTSPSRVKSSTFQAISESENLHHVPRWKLCTPHKTG